MKYVAAMDFRDLQDERFLYHKGDEYPRKGFSVTENRINQLLTGKNPSKLSLIEAVEEKPVQTAETPKKAVKSRKKTA